MVTYSTLCIISDFFLKNQDLKTSSHPPATPPLFFLFFFLNLILKKEAFYKSACAPSGWLGRAMVLGSFQCRGVLLLWHMVGQGPAVLAASAGREGYFL